MLAEIAALGFEYAELSHGIRLSLVPGIVKALDEKLVRIRSTHNFCPLPPGVNTASPNLFLPTTADEKQARQWERYTRRSIDFAHQVGASILVTHMGAVSHGWINPAKKVARLAEVRRPNDSDIDRLQAAVAEAMPKIAKKRGAPMDRLVDRISSVLEQARATGVRLGAENREKVDELPFDVDMLSFLEQFPADAPIAYWHDCGHAHLKEKMGLLRHEDHLSAHASRLAGFHLHDVCGFRDHMPPGAGEIDFAMIAKFVRPEHVLVLELNPRLEPAEVVEARDFLVKVFANAAPARQG
ncbi:MAG: sugar phosphate isomerase/epimerase [Opitutaceae bacterium]|nr:sugar phosphate isomerase/epimerase [Opitutaceae bacterium]